MQFKNLILTPLVAAGIASAAPNPDVEVFQAIALRSASPVHHTYLQASKNSLFLKLKDQGASCDRGVKADAATFSINKKTGEVLLYSSSNPRQQLFTDRSGMGQGVLQYRTGAQPLCTRCEQDKWAINKDGQLQYDGKDFRACPLEDGSYSVWISAGVDNPAGNKDCIPFTLTASEVDEPVGCLYTQQGQ
ncbi:related to cell wall protein PhiA [Fusarium torulosum]|uniref:Related to cell wall protein PhiA n=1 Tax=Fusarium torulosum TaxID=33205 RepID=A0AAE8SFS2_9HYPO|nr:related to cell wall protein PhiA [Fusarium torulosum]